MTDCEEDDTDSATVVMIVSKIIVTILTVNENIIRHDNKVMLFISVHLSRGLKILNFIHKKKVSNLEKC